MQKANRHAGIKIPVDVPAVQANVLTLFRKYGPMDDYTLIAMYRDHYDADVSESTPRTRRRELVDLGLLRDTKLKTIAVSGRDLTVWGF